MSTAPEALRRDFGGDIIERGDDGYDAASRTVLVGGSPAYVLRPSSVGTSEPASHSRERKDSGPRCGAGGTASPASAPTRTASSSTSAPSTPSTSSTTSDPSSASGAAPTWGQVVDALAPHGLAISSGDTRTVGVGGLTLSGGIGWKVRKYGLALDNLVAAEIVTASGEILRASGEANPELFWAIRGGGGNLGVVTAFEFLAHRTTDVFFGTISFPAAEAADGAGRLGGVLPRRPGGAHVQRRARQPVHGRPRGAGPGRRRLRRRRRGARSSRPSTRSAGSARCSRTTSRSSRTRDILEEGMVPPPGIEFLTRSGFADEDSVPKVIQTSPRWRPSEGSPIIGLRSVGGAVSRVPEDATAYAHRSRS